MERFFLEKYNTCVRFEARFSESPKGYSALQAERIPADALQKMEKIVGADDFNRFVLLLTIIELALSRYSQQDSIAFFTPFLRKGDDTGSIEAVPFTFDMNSQATLKDVIKEQGKVIVNSYRLQNYLKTIDETESDKIHTTMGIYCPQLHASVNALHRCRFILTVDLSKEEIILSLQDRKNTERVLDKGIIKLIIQFLSFLNYPDTEVKLIPWYPDEELKHMAAHGSAVRKPVETSIITLFEEQVSRSSQLPALTFKNQQYSYQELSHKINALAAYLKTHAGIGAESRVALYFERSDLIYISIFAILKCGAAYVPIDPKSPKARTEFILKDSEADLILCDSLFNDKNIETTVNTLSLDETPAAFQSDEASLAEPVKIDKDTLAYIIYTSGSTGNPKGVKISHKSIINLVINNEYNAVGNGKHILQLSSYSFDGSVFDIFSTFLNGGHLYVPETSVVLNSNLLRAYIAEQNINVMFITTALFNELANTSPELFKQFEKIYFGGQEVSVSHVRKALVHCRPGCLVHMYGPTETTVFATYYVIHHLDEEATNVPIGKPITGLSTFVLDKEGHMVYPFVEGEIFIAGNGVADGYLNNEALTKERFVSIPSLHHLYAYRTGDFGELDAQGNLIFKGRKDGQCKIRGYRVEVGEVLNAILKVKGISNGFVKVGEEAAGDKMLIGYYQGSISASDLKKELALSLPEYMIPSFLVEVETFPFTVNGKIDASRLPDYSVVPEKGDLPKTPTETGLVEIWKSILEIEAIDAKANFFELGGQSIKAMRIMAAVAKEFQVELQVVDIFKYPELHQLAAFIDQSLEQALPDLAPAGKRDLYRLSVHQEPLWLAHKMGQRIAYNQVFHFKMTGSLDSEILAQAFNTSVNRHEILRTSFTEHQGEAYQKIHEALPVSLPTDDISHTVHPEKYVQDYIQSEISHELNIEQAPLFRLKLFFTGTAHYCVFTIHHIIFDAASIRILLNDVFSDYKNISEGREIVKNAPVWQYKDFSEWYNKLIHENHLQKYKAYWITKIQEHKSFHAQKPIADTAGEGYTIVLNSGMTRQLNAISHTHNLTVFTCLYTLFKIILSKYYAREKLIIGTPGSMRVRPELENIIGYFVNPVPVYAVLQKGKTLKEALADSREEITESLKYSLYSGNLILKDLREFMGADVQLFDFSLTLADQREVNRKIVEVALNDLEIVPSDIDMEDKTSRYNLEVVGIQLENEIKIRLHYKTKMYSKADIEEIEKCFFTLMEYMTDSMNTLVEEIQLTELKKVNDLTSNLSASIGFRFN